VETQTLVKLLKNVMIELRNLPHVHHSSGNYTSAAIFTNQTKAIAFAREINLKTPYDAVVEKEWHHKEVYVDQPTYVVGIREKTKRCERRD